MKERISQLAGGEIFAPVPALELPKQTVEASIEYGQNYRGDIHFMSGNQLAFRGLISSDSSRVLLLQNTYSGTNVYIPFEVVTDGLEAGTVLNGFFSLVYNGGEYRLPYHFEILNAGQTREVPMVSLEDFAQYAKSHPQEAADVIDTREFVHLPFMEDMTVRAIYDGLRRSAGRRNLAEEFLCGTGAKERVVLTADRSEDQLTIESRELKGSLEIRRNTWGRIDLHITSDHDGVQPACTDITDQDFEDDVYRLVYIVNQEKLHSGHNYARITVKAPLQTLTLELDIISREQDGHVGRKLHERHASEFEFYRTWLKFMAEDGERKDNLDMMQYCWEEMVHEDEPSTRQQLYRAAIAVWKDDRELAASVLDSVKAEVEEKRREDVDTYCAYLWLQLQVVKEDWERREQIIKILRLYCGDKKISEFRFLLNLYMDQGRTESPTDTMEKIRNYFYEDGSRNPFLYIQACRIINSYPDILKSLDEFELHVLLFGARIGALSEKAALYVASAASVERGYHSLLFRILKLLYKKYEKDEILGGICQMLIRSDRRDSRDFTWFERGVRKDLRLTRLYDFFLYTVPEDYDEPFPREIMLYFSYNSPRDPEAQKVLYRNLFRFSGEDRSMMDSYRQQLKDYVYGQIAEGRVDRETARIFSGMLTRESINEKMAKILPDILKSREIRCEYKKFSAAIAVYGETEEEKSVPMKDGVASLPVYTSRCRVIFVDKYGCRYAGVPYESEPLFRETDDILDRCMEICPKHAMMRLARSTEILSSEERTLEQVRFLRKELETYGLRKAYRQEIMSAIADYIISRKNPDAEDVIACVRYTGISPAQRNQLVQILIELGQLTEAAVQVRLIGFRQLPTASLLRLVSLTLQNGFFEMDERTLDMSYYLFTQGQSDEIVLEYLCTHYNSDSRNMTGVLLEADRRGISQHGMGERLLSQMLFSGTKEKLDEVYRICEKQENLDPMLIHAYYSVKSAEYFMDGKSPDEEVMKQIRALVSNEADTQNVPLIWRLAVGCRLAEQTELTEDDKKLGETLALGLYRRGMVFAWMKKLAGRIRMPEMISQREWLEYRGEADQNLQIRTVLCPEDEDSTASCVNLPQIYPGIYAFSVLLFEGETMSYEILQEEDRTVLSQGVLTGRASAEDDHSRFAELNRLQSKVKNPDDVTKWQDDVTAYGMQDAWTEQIFTIG